MINNRDLLYVHYFTPRQKFPGSLRMLVSAILLFYIEKHGQTYP